MFPKKECVCVFCRTRFAAKGDLIKHLPCASKPAPRAPPKPRQCTKCWHKFPSGGALFRHLIVCVAVHEGARQSHPPIPKSCRRCSLVCASGAALFAHLKECGATPLPPTRSGLRFANFQPPPPPKTRVKVLPPPPRVIVDQGVEHPSRRAHKRYLKTQPPAPTRPALPKPIQLPKAPRPRSCVVCDKRFPSVNQFWRHKRRHGGTCYSPPPPTAEKQSPPVPVSCFCAGCRAPFASKRKWRSHTCAGPRNFVLRAHQLPPPPPPPGFLRCLDCSHDFGLRRNPSRRCPICGEVVPP
jgi:hypothetical protein